MPVGYDKFGKCLQAGAGRIDAATLQTCNPSNPAQVFRSSAIKSQAFEVLYSFGPNCCLDWTGSSVVPFNCHGGVNQLWTYTFASELRVNKTADLCLEYDDAGWKNVVLTKCTGADKQKWTISANSQRVVATKKPSLCLDFSTSPVTLASCTSFTSTILFDTARLVGARSRNLRRTVVQGPWVYVGTNCMNVDRSTKNAFLDICVAGREDFWWEYTSSGDLKLPGNKCLDMSLTEANRVLLWDCNGQTNQQWNYDATNGIFTNAHGNGNGKCLSFNTANVSLWTDIKFEMEPCTVATRKDNQYFLMPELDGIVPPTTANQQSIYCAARNNAENKGGNAVPFLRDTLAYAKSDFKYLVPTVLSEKEAYNYHSSVVLETLSLALGSPLGYSPMVENDVVAKLVATSSGSLVLVELAELMCQVQQKPADLKSKIDTFLNIDKPTNNRLIGTVSYMRVGNVLLLSSGALSGDSASPRLASDSVAKSINDEFQAYITNNDLQGLLTMIDSDDVKGFVQDMQTVCKLKSSLSVCGIAFMSGLSQAKTTLASAIAAAATSTTTSGTLQYITPAVKDKAAAFMDTFHKGFATGSPVNTALWTAYAQALLFQLPPTTTYAQSAMERTMTVPDLVLVLSVWPYFLSSEIQSATWNTLFSRVSDQLNAARRKFIARIVFNNPASSLEAYMDGRTSDMASLVNDALVPICTPFGSLFAMYDLTKFYSLTSARAVLQRTLVAQYGDWTTSVSSLAATFAATYTSKLALNDTIWTPMAKRLVFDSVQLQVLTNSTLKTTARPGSYLLSYTVLEQYSNAMGPLLPFYTFLLDQITPAHYSAINTLVANRDVDGMTAYLDPANNATISDLGVLGRTVLPHVCNNPNNPDLSICKLQEFYIGLLQVVAFEMARSRPSAISLVDLVEVDVRKQLDVIDGENKQFEIITTIQDAANQIGAEIVEESGKIQATVQSETASIRSDIDASTKLLYDKMGEEGRKLQAQIDDSTRKLETAVGDAANSLRNQINDATDKLYNKIGQEGQAIRDKIDESTRTLTDVINTSTEKLSAKIDASTSEIVGKVKSGFTALGNFFKSDSDASLTTLLAQIKNSQSGTQTLVDGLLGQVNALVDALERSKRDANDAGIGQGFALAADIAIQGAKIAQESGKCANIFAWASGSADPVAIAEAGSEIAKLTTQIQVVAQDIEELKYKSNQFNSAAQKLKDAVASFTKAQDKLAQLVVKIEQIQGGTLSADKTKALASSILELYQQFDLGVSATDIATLGDVTSSYLDIIMSLISGQSVGFPGAAMYGMRRAKDQVAPVFAALQELYDEFNGQWEQLGQAARSAANSQAADAISASQSRRLLRQLASAPFKPFYSMQYAGLSRLFMQYRIQKAAFDFCMFYQYKVGGVPPSMCVTNAKFYTPTDIQKMRSYSTPTLKSYTMTALLPTRPTPIGSDPANAVQRPRPYLNLDKLLAGEKVPFTLPVDDISWLKKYLWARSTDTATSLAGVYIQSMQVVLPFTLAANVTPSGNTFTMVSSVDVGRGQRLNSQSNAVYTLPPMNLRFESSLYEPFCSNEITNPYHQSAKCISEDGSSTLCVIEDGSPPRTDLLPSLFSAWEISSPKDLVNQPGADFKLALPSNTTDAVDLNVVVQLKVIRVTAPTTSSQISPMASTCCPADSYWLKTACAKCPGGSTGALNGYSCQRA